MPSPAAGLVYVFLMRSPLAHFLSWQREFDAERYGELLAGRWHRTQHRANFFVRTFSPEDPNFDVTFWKEKCS